MSNKLFVGGLSWGTTDQTLRDFFAQAGTVVSASVIMDKFSGKSKGFGFVEMSTPEEAEKAMQTLNGQSLDGRNIAVSEARPQAPRENRGPRSFGGGGGGGYNRNRGHHDDRGDDRGGRNW
jgi:RNA recognition motif-containing protein